MSARPLCTYTRLGLVGMVMTGVVLLQAAETWAKILRHVDPDGVIWFTNIPPPPAERVAPRHAPAAKRPPRALRAQTHPYRMEVESLAQQYGLHPSLVSALMAVESDFDPLAVSASERSVIQWGSNPGHSPAG